MKTIKNIVALITPFKEDFSIDYDAFETHLNFLFSQKPDGLFVNATTGEFTSLNFNEKLDVAKFVLEHSSGVPVYVNVHSNVMSEAIELSKFAKSLGFYAIVSPPPFFLIPSQKGIIEYFHTIAKESNLPTFIYNIPALTGYSISVETVREIAKIPLIKGIKVTYDNITYLLNLINEVKSLREDFEIFTGTEQLYVPLIISGGDGGVMALANIALQIFNDVKVAFNNNDLSSLILLHRKIAKLTEIYSLTTSFGYAIKIALGYMGKNVKRFVRRPLLEDPFDETRFIQVLESGGLIWPNLKKKS